MALLLRFGVVLLLWLFARRKSPAASYATERASSLSWPQKARLIAGLSRDRRVPGWARLFLLLPVLYVLSPIDLLPDLIPIVGRLDDGLIFSFAFGLVARFAPPSVLSEHLDAIARERNPG